MQAQREILIKAFKEARRLAAKGHAVLAFSCQGACQKSGLPEYVWALALKMCASMKPPSADLDVFGASSTNLPNTHFQYGEDYNYRFSCNSNL